MDKKVTSDIRKQQKTRKSNPKYVQPRSKPLQVLTQKKTDAKINYPWQTFLFLNYSTDLKLVLNPLSVRVETRNVQVIYNQFGSKDFQHNTKKKPMNQR